MMATLEAQPTYHKFVPSTEQQQQEQQPDHEHEQPQPPEQQPQPTEEQGFTKPQEQPAPPQEQPAQEYDTIMAHKHKLPLSDSLRMEHPPVPNGLEVLRSALKLFDKKCRVNGVA
jgi:hypothetical protein